MIAHHGVHLAVPTAVLLSQGICCPGCTLIMTADPADTGGAMGARFHCRVCKLDIRIPWRSLERLYLWRQRRARKPSWWRIDTIPHG
jgi:hypothetical protein